MQENTRASFNRLSKIALAAVATTVVTVYYGCSLHGNGATTNTRQLRMFDPKSIDEKKAPLGHNFGDGLEFVHITKTGGAAIETAAWDAKQLNWGACHFMEWQNVGCNNPDWNQKSEWIGPSQQDRKYSGEPWFAPPQWLHPNPYNGKDTFCVIRNPYDRIVNEYEVSTSVSSKDPRQMNEWIQMRLREVMKMTTYPGHFLPQHLYVYNHHRKRTMTHILRYENLQEDFDQLMSQYNLNIKLPPGEILKKAMDQNEYFSKMSLSPDSISLINELYGADFRAFGYTMVERPSQFTENSSGTNFGITQKIADKLAINVIMQEQLPPGHTMEDHAQAVAQQASALVGFQKQEPEPTPETATAVTV